jgi:alpha-2-macroglobulin
MIRFRGIAFLIVLTTVALWSQQKKEVKILFAAPQGMTVSIDQSARIFATFNEPMVALAALPVGQASGPMTVEPAVRGTYRWLGTTTFAFTPEDTLPFATQFTVTIPAGTRSLAGAALKEAYRWTFETPRPSVVRITPADGQRQVELDHAIFVTFNQPIDPAVISKWISLEVRSNFTTSYPAFTVRIPTEKELDIPTNRRWMRPVQSPSLQALRGRSIVIVPSAPFMRDSFVRIVCKAGLQGTQGKLGMTNDFTSSFSTYGDLKFVGIRSDQDFNPNYGLRFEFTNPVVLSDLLAHLEITPEAKLKEIENGEYQSDKHYLYLPLQPEQSYSGRIKAGMKDIFGNILETDAPFTFRTSGYEPYVRMTTGPGILEANEVHAVPVSCMNTDSVRVRMGMLTPDRIVPLMTASNFWGNDEWTDAQLSGAETFYHPLPASHTVRISSKRNMAVTKPIDLNEALGTSPYGIAYVQVKNFSPFEARVLKTVVQVTNIGLTAKFSPDSILIWATHLNDVSAAAAADVEIRTDSNRIVWRGRTDARGLCSAPGWGRLGIEPLRETYGQNDEYESVRPPRLWVIVHGGSDCAFTSSQWNEGIEPYSFGLEADWNPQFEKYEASVFTDRGLYKAGETVDVKAIVRMRREGAWHIADHAGMRVRVMDPRNEEMWSQEATLNSFGSFSVRIPLKAATPTGSYRISVESKSGTKTKTGWTSIAGGEFRVEAFRAAEFDVTAKMGRDQYTLGDTVSGFINARYLFGAAMKKAPVQWRFSLNPASFTPNGFDNYYFGLEDWLSDFPREASHRVLTSGSGTLDNFGSYAVSVPLRTSDIRGTVSLMLEGDAVSASRQTLSGRSSAIVHGGEYYVGIRPSTTFLSTDSALTINIVAVTSEGVPVSGKSVAMKIYQRMWHSVRKAETGARYAWQTEASDSLVDSTMIATSAEPAVHIFTPRQAGFYYISASSTDARGNRIKSQAALYVSGRGYVAWERSDDDRIELIADRTNYRAGDAARIIVKNPYESATALVSVEREGILSHYTTILTGSAPQLVVPIEKNYFPNVFISVVLLQGRIDKPAAAQAADIGRPSFKVGYVKLSVSPKEKLLSVKVTTAQQEYRPGDSVTVSVSVRNSRSQGVVSEVTLSVADLGVLNLIGYHLPNPFDAFYKERGLAVTTTETRLHLIDQRSFGEKGEDAGGGGAAKNDVANLDEEGMRKDFRPSAYWNPTLLTNDSGVAEVRFKLPDNITAFKAMAVAQTKNSDFGEADASFSVSKPVLLQPSLPRFARVGDSFDAGVVVMNYTAAPRSVTLKATASGIRIKGNDSMIVVLQPGQAREITYRFTAEQIGTATVNATVVSGGERDGLRWTFPVIAPRERETVAMFNSTADTKKEEAIAPPQNVYPNSGDIAFTASSTALVGLSGGISYLFTYPYGCLEQRASALLPLLFAKDLVDAFSLDVLKGKNVKQLAQKTVDELPLFQKFNGGFSYWKSDEQTSPYVSAYAVYTLLQAQRNGYTVDPRVIENGLQYLTRVIGGEERDVHFSLAVSQCTRALIVYTFALAGKPDFGTMDKLYSNRASLPLFAKAYLLKAAATAGKNPAMIAELSRDLMNHAKVDPVTAHFEEQNESGLVWIFSSTTRTTALILQALVETNAESDLIPKAVRWLLNAQRNGRWRTTQENIYVVDALATYFKKYEKETPKFKASIAVEGRQILTQMFAGRSLDTKTTRMPLDEAPKQKQARVTIGKEGPGRLYYGMRMTYYPKGVSQERDEGVTILRSLEPVESPAGTAIRAGMLMKVTVSVIAHQDRSYLVVEDPVPAGFEVVSTAFQTTAANLQNDQPYYSVFTHVERYDDRVAMFANYVPAGIHSYTYLVRAVHSGTYAMPSTRAECMYEPEVFGLTTSGTVTIH